MRQARTHLIVLSIVLGVLGLSFFAGYSTAVRLGLDLQGGLEVILKAQPKQGQKLTSEDITKSVEIIRSRVDKLGVSEPEIRPQGTDEITVSLPGIKNPQSAVDVIGSTAQLRFYDFQKLLVGNKAYRSPYELLKRYQDQVKAGLKKHKRPDAWYLFDGSKILVAGPVPTKTLLYEKYNGKQPEGFTVYGVPPGLVLVHGDQGRAVPINNVDTSGQYDRAKGVYVLLKDKPALTGTGLKNAMADTSQGGWVVRMMFTKEGQKQFGEVTEDLAQAGALAGVDQSFSIVLDDEIKSSPTIDYKRDPSGLHGPEAEINGMDNQNEAKGLAIVLNTGSLPVQFEKVSTTQVSATLGRQALSQGLSAGFVGLLIVMGYLVLFYRFFGIVADIALVCYAIIFYGMIVTIPIVMTLPGIAGMILTIGVAADANIIIFERIREEYRSGRGIAASIAAGYSKGLKTIVDANVVTLITAFVLGVVSVGEVRGFALLLGLGVILSMFTAVAATYALVGLVGDLPVIRHPRMIGASRKPLRFKVKWMRYRNMMFVWTVAVILTSVVFIGWRGLNLGIDFRSGTRIDVVFSQKVTEKQLRSQLGKINPDYAKATIQSRTAPAGTSTSKRASAQTSSFTIQLERLATGVGGSHPEMTIQNNLNTAFHIEQKRNASHQVEGNSFDIRTIGASFGNQVKQGAIFAVIVSLLLVVLYIGVRFGWKYSLPVIIALAHDMIVATGAYAITGREFKSSTVAALLTILGYSMYDTIIVFDRVRENTRVLRKSSFSRIVDASLNEVLMRSINTTFVTLLPVGAIFFYGGETLQDFAYALLVGIFAGAYSSLVIASPILVWMKEREPSWARRRGSDPYSEAAAEPAKVIATVGATSSTSIVNDTVVEQQVEVEGTRPPTLSKDKRSRAQRRKK